MSRGTFDSRIELFGFGLDALGRVVLSDDLLDVIDEFEGPISAGGNNMECPGPGPANGSCTNGYCDSSANSVCANIFSCGMAINFSVCKEPREVPEE